MIINKIEINDYRSCISTTFSPDGDLSVLIGPNGSGKTNILNAILLLKKLTAQDADEFVNEDLATADSKIKVWFSINGKKVILTAKIKSYTDESNNDVIVRSEQSWYMKDFTGSAKRLKMPLWFAHNFIGRGSSQKYQTYLNHKFHFGGGDLVDLRGFSVEGAKALSHIASELSQIRYYSASQFTNPSTCPVSFEIQIQGQKRRGFRLRGHAKFLYNLYSEANVNSDSYEQFFDIIGPKGIGLVDEIAFREILTSSIEYSVRSGGRVRKRKREKSLIVPQFKIGNQQLSPNQLSEGTFKTITLVFYLVTESSSILLVEEPEVCVHHGLLSSIMELIRVYSYDKQIIVSTHSDFVLDQVEPSSVHRVTRSCDTGTIVSNITKTMSSLELNALREYLDSEGNLGEYWRHGALEG